MYLQVHRKVVYYKSASKTLSLDYIIVANNRVYWMEVTGAKSENGPRVIRSEKLKQPI